MNRTCHLCGRNGCTDPLDRHHVFGGAFRKKSEKYGLVVDLCHHDCHIFGAGAAHQNAEVAEELHKWGQRKVMREQGWTMERFILEFGCNYLDEEEIAEFQREQQSYGIRDNAAAAATPHQSPEATASPRGEAFKTRESSFKVLPDAFGELPWGCMA